MGYPGAHLLIQELQNNPIEWLYLIGSIAAILLLTGWLDSKQAKKNPPRGCKTIHPHKTEALSGQQLLKKVYTAIQVLKKRGRRQSP